jgi:nicotinate-nucleotide adenylyltransferase
MREVPAADPTGGLRRRIKLRLRLPDPPPPPQRRLRVGLLGGSFNPAHAGHVYASVEALKRLALDQVWWLVSPQNPLKPKAGMASLAARFAAAEAVASHPRIRVTALEARFGTRFTVDTLSRLATWRGHDFVWLIGADNLLQLPRWRHWRRLFDLASIAAVERQPYSYRSLAGPAAVRFASARLPESRAAELAGSTPPAWAFLRLRPHPASSTAIRGAQRAGQAASSAKERWP